MQVKTTMSYNLTTIRMSIIKNTSNKCWCECKFIQPLWKTVFNFFLQKIKNSTTLWSSNSTSRYISKGNENRISKRHLHFHVHCSIIHDSQDMETTSVSVNRWMDKEEKNILWNGILFSHEKEGNSTICDNMDGTWGHYAKWNKSERKRQLLYYITYILNQKRSNS